MDLKAHFNKERDLEVNATKDIEFVIYSKAIWQNFLRHIPEKKSKILDIGSGGGTVLQNLDERGYNNLSACDLVNAIPENFLHKINFIEGDITNLKLPDSSYDAIISSMVIEHIKDDSSFVSEINRLLNNNGIALITSILKKKHGWYFYKNEFGDRVLDPTHIREYKNENSYKELFDTNFKIIDFKTTQLKYTLVDPILKKLHKVTKIGFFKDLNMENPFISFIRKLRIPIFGYYAIEILLKKKL